MKYTPHTFANQLAWQATNANIDIQLHPVKYY